MKKCNESPNLILEEGPGKLEVIGPMKIVLVEPTCRIIWAQAFTFLTILSQILMAGVTSLVVIHILKKDTFPCTMDWHVLLCTIGHQFIISQSILSLNSFIGFSMFVKPKYRKITHSAIAAFGGIMALIGSALIIFSNDIHLAKLNLHGFSGCVASVFNFASLLNGACAIFAVELGSPKLWKMFHVIVSVPAYILSSITFVLGLLLESNNQTKEVQSNHSLQFQS